jgi:UDP-N-acetylmuramate dehydrogenase
VSVLAAHTTLRVGGPAAETTVVETEADLIAAVRAADAAGRAITLLGGGSNVVCGDEPLASELILIRTRGRMLIDANGLVQVSVQAGEPWDAVVAWTLSEGLTGLEALSGIPGLTGATPIQNVGAYGGEIAEVLDSVAVLDRRTGDISHLTAPECDFGYRMSRFKRQPDRWVILAVTMTLKPNAPAPVRYAELARALNVAVGDAVPAEDVRAAVLDLRRAKGMVLDDDDHDTWSVGSFFTNPIVPASVADTFPPDCPRYPAESGVKLSAAWLLESAELHRGWGMNDRATLSTKHVLAITNRGAATAADILALAAEIRDRVQSVHGITLEVEPRLLGCELAT